MPPVSLADRPSFRSPAMRVTSPRSGTYGQDHRLWQQNASYKSSGELTHERAK
jgi:hypothetical protein